MDSNYVIKVLVTGFDMVSKPLKDAAMSVKQNVDVIKKEWGSAFGSGGSISKDIKASVHDLEALKGSFDGVGNSSEVQGRKVRTFFTAFRGISNMFKDATRDVRAFGKEWESVGASLREAMGPTQRIPFLPNIPIVPLVAALAILIPLLLQLGGALLAVASAAVIAAAAIGGALVAGMAELAPIALVLVATFSQFGDVIKLLTGPTDQLANANYGLASAHQAVKNAQQGVAQAETALAQARKQAARDIVDANNAEKDSVLATRGAVLSLLEARQRLAQDEGQTALQQSDIKGEQARVTQLQNALSAAINSGNPQAIDAAKQALSLSQGNLAQMRSAATGNPLTIRSDRLAVQQAQQSLVEQRITEARAIENANRLNKLGVEQSPGVVSAKQQEAAAVQALAAAYHSLSTAQTAYQAASPKALSPAQQGLYGVLKPFLDQWDKIEAQIAAPIINGITSGLKQALPAVFGPGGIMGSIDKLSQAMGKSIGQFIRFLTTPQALAVIKTITEAATKNFPAFVKILEDTVTLFGKIAIAATPLFTDLLDHLVKFFDGANTVNTDKLTRFFDKAGAYAIAFGDLALNMIRFLDAVVSGTAGSGLKAVESLSKWFNNLATSLSKPEARKDMKAWFDDAVKNSGTLLGSIVKIVTAVVDLFSNPKNADTFSQFIKELPDILQKSLDILKIMLDIFTKIFDAVSAIPGLKGIAGWGAALVTVGIVLSPVASLFSAMAGAAGLILRAFVGLGKLTFGGLSALLAALKGARVPKIPDAPAGRGSAPRTPDESPTGGVPGETAAGPSKAGTLFKGLAEIGNAAFLGLLAGEIYKWAIGNNYKDPGVKIKSRGDETLYYNSNSQQFYVGIGQTNQKIDNAGAAKFLGVSENALIKFVTGATTQDPHHRGFAEGGAIGGNTAGQAVQVTAHTGEWILNAYQQMRLAAAGFGGNVRGLQSWLFGGPQAMPQPGRGGPTVKKTGGLTYALDTDAYGNTITFVELRDGTWGQIAVAPSGKAPLIPGNPSIASGRLHHRGRYQSLVDSLIKGGDIGLGTALGKKYGLGFDPTDYGRIAPAGSGPSGGFAAGGVVTGGNRAGGTTVVAHMPIYTQQVEADVDYIGQRMTMHLESAV